MMITGSNWEFLPILYLDVLRLIKTIDFSGNSENGSKSLITYSLDKIRYFGAGPLPPQRSRHFSKSLFRRETSNLTR